MKSKINILIIGPFPKPISGVSLANKVVCDILNKKEQFKVSGINSSYPVFKDSIGSFSLKKVFFYLKLNFNFLKIFKNDIIYITPGQTFFGITKYSLFILFSSFLNKELIIHVHGNYLGQQYKLLKGTKKKIFYFLLSKFDKGIVLSTSLKQNLTPFLTDNNIYILPNFAEDYLLKDTSEVNTDSLKIVYLSNLMEEKGILILLKSLLQLEQHGINYQAKIAGNIDDNLKNQVNHYLQQLPNTQYLGAVYNKEKKKLLHWSNIFVLPTFYTMEGQPISILEALATNNVIIATDHAGIKDVIKHNVHGKLIAKKNTKELTETFIYYHNNLSLLSEISKQNKNYFVNNFSVTQFGNNIISILNA